jgi:hypothetical protein
MNYKPLPDPPSALQAVGDVLETPFIAADALVRGGQAYTNTGELGKVVNEVRTKGMRGLQDVTDRYALMAPEQLQDEAAHGDRVAEFMLHHPKIAGGADFVGEFANPSNWIVPPVARFAGRLAAPVGRAAAELPGIRQTVNATRDTFDPTWRVAQEAAERGHDPKEGAAAARDFMGARTAGDTKARKYIDLFKGLTPEEEIELERRSENFGRDSQGKPIIQNPPNRNLANRSRTDAELDRLAAKHRALLRMVDIQKLKSGQAVEDQLIKNNQYTPRYGPEVYTDPHAHPELTQFIEENDLGQRTGAGSGGSYSTGTLNKHKKYLSYDEIKRAEAKGLVKLSEKYSPVNNLLVHLRNHFTNEEVLRATEEFKRLGLMKDFDFSKYFGTPWDEATKTGDKAMRGIGPERTGAAGYANMVKYLRRVADPIAREKAIAAMQKSGSKITGTIPRLTLGKQIGRTLEAKRAAEKAGITAQAPSVQQAGNRVASEVRKRFPGQTTPGQIGLVKAPAVQAAAYVAGQGTRAQSRYINMLNILNAQRLSKVDAETFYRIKNHELDDTHRALVDKNLREVERNVKEKEGNFPHAGRPVERGTRAPLTPQVGKGGNYVSVTPGLEKFLNEQGAPEEGAKALGRAIDTLNKWSRMAIISNPAVHVLWNLNMQFLGARGDLRDLSDIWSGAFTDRFGWQPDKKLLEEAEKHGAIVHMAPSFKGVLGTPYNKIIGSPKGLSLGERIDRESTRFYNANQNWVFEHMEQRFAVKLYQRFKDQGMTPAAAGIAVRKALGDYANISKEGLEAELRKAMFFYPWVKTIIPFWMNALVMHPQAWNAPMEGIRVNNLNQNDPNIDSQKPFTMALGQEAQGSERYFSWPDPARILNEVLQSIFPRGDLTGGVTERAKALTDIAQNHFNPVLDDLVDTTATTLDSEPQEPEDADHILWNKNAPNATEFGQWLFNSAERVAPLPLQLRQAIDFGKNVATGSEPPQERPADMLAGAGMGLIGGTSYSAPPKAYSSYLRYLGNQLAKNVAIARKLGREDLVKQYYDQYTQLRAKLRAEQRPIQQAIP